MTKRYCVLLEAEIEADSPEHVQTILDNFREAVCPADNYGVVLTRATPRDISKYETHPGDRFIAPVSGPQGNY